MAFFKFQRRLHHLIQNAVNPVSDPETSLIRFDMNVTGLLFDGIGQDQVDEFDDRGILGGPFKRADIDIIVVADDLDVFHIEIAHYVGKRSRLIVILIDSGFDGCL